MKTFDVFVIVAVCVVQFVVSDNRCDEMPYPLRRLLSGVDESQCISQRDCWNGNQCFTEKSVANPCFTQDRMVCTGATASTTLEQCSDLGCCYDGTDNSEYKCYLPSGCWNEPGYHGRCSRSCGVGQRSLYNGCGFFLGYSACCNEPCPQTVVDVTGGATCTSSGQLSSSFGCENALDSVITPTTPGSEWASPGQGDNAWIQITFPTAVCVKKVVLFFRCSAGDQSSKYLLSFSDGRTIEHLHPCNGGASSTDCAGQGPETVNVGAVTTSSLRIRGSDACPPGVPGNNGFREIVVLGSPSCGGSSSPPDPDNPPPLCKDVPPYGPL